MESRPYAPPDADVLAEVYRDAVRTLGPAAYAEDPVRAWAMHPEDLEALRRDLTRGCTLRAVIGDEPAAFGQLFPADHIAYLYVRHSPARA